MKTLGNLFTILFVIGMFVRPAMAGREAGGGHAVQVKDKLYLFDFFEHGIEEAVFFSPNCSIDPVILNKVRGVLNDDTDISKKVTCKLQEIRAISEKLYIKLADTLFSYQWNRILPELFHQYDVGSTPIKNDSGLNLPLFQAALRF